MTTPTARLTVALGLTGTVLAGEVVVGLISGSLALLADAGHMFVDSAGLVVALVTARLSTRPATDRSTWGLRRAEAIGATLQAGALAAIGVLVAVEAVRDLNSPQPVAAGGMAAMGVIGLLANILSLVVLAGGRGTTLSMRAAFLEVLGDTLGSVGVMLAAGVIAVTGWHGADAVASLVIVALIVPRAIMLLRDTGRVLMDFTPAGLDLAEVRRHILEVDHVEAVHDLHAWTVASDLPVLTAHVVVGGTCLHDGHAEVILDDLQACLTRHFPVRIEHTTFQLEPAHHAGHESACALRPAPA